MQISIANRWEMRVPGGVEPRPYAESLEITWLRNDIGVRQRNGHGPFPTENVEIYTFRWHGCGLFHTEMRKFKVKTVRRQYMSMRSFSSRP